MVYKTQRLNVRSMRMMLLRHGVIFWVLMVAGYYLLEMATEGSALVELNPWVLAAFALPALGLAILGMRRMMRYRGQWENLFFTLTEGGVLYECEQEQLRMFIPWSLVTMARRSGNVVNLFLRNGRSLSCILEGVEERRQREFFTFALTHAGKGNDKQLTPPPAELMSGEPLRFSATKVQVLEVSDAMCMINWTRRTMLLLLVRMMILGAVLIYAAYTANFWLALVGLLFFLSCVYRAVHPGIRQSRRGAGVGVDVYVQGMDFLQVKDDGLWMSVRDVKPQSAIRLKYCDFYSFDKAASVALDIGQPRPLQWPEPVTGPLRRFSTHMLVGLVLAVLIAAGAAFSQSRFVHLYCAVNDINADYHTRALAGVSEESEATVSLSHRFTNTTWLKTRNVRKRRDVAFIAIWYPEGRNVALWLDIKGKVIATDFEEESEIEAEPCEESTN